MRSRFRKFLLVLFAVAIVAAMGWGLVPEPIEVDLAKVTQGEVEVTVDEDGKTRIREKYVVSAPLAGRVLRINMDPGDKVKADETLLATIEPRDPELLDARTIAQAEARVKAAEASLEKMEPLLEEVTAAQQFAEAELNRVSRCLAQQVRRPCQIQTWRANYWPTARNRHSSARRNRTKRSHGLNWTRPARR